VVVCCTIICTTLLLLVLLVLWNDQPTELHNTADRQSKPFVDIENCIYFCFVRPRRICDSLILRTVYKCSYLLILVLVTIYIYFTDQFRLGWMSVEVMQRRTAAVGADGWYKQFTGRMPQLLSLNQQCQSTECVLRHTLSKHKFLDQRTT